MRVRRPRRDSFPSSTQPLPGQPRAGATLDYVLVLGAIMPLGVIVIPTGIRMVRAVYEMTCTLVAWPFM